MPHHRTVDARDACPAARNDPCLRLPTARARGRALRDDGQAAVEFVALLPCALALLVALWQLALAGHAAWACANAARVAARADAVGRDAEAAARSALPRRLERGLEVRTADAGRVNVSVRVPLVVPWRRSPVTVGASARLEEAG
jgi:hypothetical protein